jgi:hypothetical protein
MGGADGGKLHGPGGAGKEGQGELTRDPLDPKVDAR